MLPSLHAPATKDLTTEILALQRMDREVVDNLDHAKFDVAIEWACNHFGNEFRNRSATVHSTPVAIQNILASDSRDGSPGYPWNSPQHPVLQRVTAKGTRLPYFTKQECYTCPYWLEWYHEHYLPSLDGDFPYVSFFSLSLKSQLVTKVKVAENNNRIFCVAPAEHMLAMVELTHDLHETIMHGSTWCSAGHSVWHGGAHNAVAPYALGHIWAGYDFKNYDLCLYHQFFRACFQVHMSCYSSEDRVRYRQRLLNLYRAALYAVVVAGFKHVYLKHTGNPSGWYMTLLMNTICLVVLISYSWLSLPQTPEICHDYESMTYHLAGTSVCGDDQRHCITPTAASFFVFPHHDKVWGNLGFTLKPGEVSNTPIGVEYCGRYLIKFCGRYVPVGRVDKFVDSCSYTTTIDPVLRLQRLISLYMECYTSPRHRSIVWGFITYLYKIYPSLATLYPKTWIPPDRRIRYWATGLDM